MLFHAPPFHPISCIVGVLDILPIPLSSHIISSVELVSPHNTTNFAFPAKINIFRQNTFLFYIFKMSSISKRIHYHLNSWLHPQQRGTNKVEKDAQKEALKWDIFTVTNYTGIFTFFDDDPAFFNLGNFDF